MTDIDEGFGITTRRAIGKSALVLCSAALFAQASTQPAQAQGEVRVAFVGDSMADGIWGSFVRLVTKDACLKGVVSVGRFAKNGTGLTRSDVFNWPAEMQRITETFQPHLTIASLGLNDRQSILIASGARIEFGTTSWREHYKDEIVKLAKSATATGGGLLWIGLPVSLDRVTAADNLEKNKLFGEAIASMGSDHVEYVTPWRLDPSGEDTYRSYGPDSRGSLIQIRAADGIHFTSAGYDMVLAYLLPAMSRMLQRTGAQLSATCSSWPKGEAG